MKQYNMPYREMFQCVLIYHFNLSFNLSFYHLSHYLIIIYRLSLCLQEDIPRQLVYIGLYLFHIAGAYLLK